MPDRSTYARLDAKLDRILQLLQDLHTYLVSSQRTMTMTLDELAKQVQANTDVEAGAVAAFTAIAAQMVANKNDPVKIQALADQLKASAAPLAAAIVANTPAAAGS
jgi:cell pole-organizing protein PopZ